MGLPEICKLELHSKHKKGKLNLITDVVGVKVGNVTIQDRDVNTGVTAIIPHGGNIFLEKVMGAAVILNGFGKSVGLVQIEELGTIETPIILTNTFSVGTAVNALTKYMLKDNPDIGTSTGTVNCIVGECNDGRLSDIRGQHVNENHIFEAISASNRNFEEGAVGGGTGMCCLGVKGGIGSASRILEVDEQEYTLGALVMTNFGAPGNLVIGGKHIDTKVDFDSINYEKKDKGSVIIVIATDIPLNERQLKRVCKRSSIALGRCGSYMGNGSGDIAIGFTTSNNIPHYSKTSIIESKRLQDDAMDPVFEAAVEAIEEAIISSLYHAKTTTGVRGSKVLSLREYL